MKKSGEEVLVKVGIGARWGRQGVVELPAAVKELVAEAGTKTISSKSISCTVLTACFFVAGKHLNQSIQTIASHDHDL